MGSDEPRRKRIRSEPVGSTDSSLGGLYDFLPPPDPAKDEAAKEQAAKNHWTRPKLPPEDRTRVIFLDVDGVLLPSGSVETIVVDGVALPVRDTVRESDFSTTALGSLRSVVQQTGATIVLSSEWRRTESLRSSIGAVLKSQDIPVCRDLTPIFHAKPELQVANPVLAWCERRAREIGSWLKDHPEVTAWVALDDLDFSWADSVRAAGTPWIKYRSVHTNDKVCLTEENVAEAVNILLNPPPEPQVAPKRSRKASVEGSAGSDLLCSTEDTPPDRIRLG
mmetsp:Transcript_123937/g.264287  ORF Transcript_123937/g.264287 Transcript_123937/m.264287 type:complete len:279 (-) Transcript_123937:44-880(-)